MQYDTTKVTSSSPVLTACRECDLLIHEANTVASPHYSALCPRCGALLYRYSRHSLEYTLALAFAALALFAVANAFPIVGLNIQGVRVDTTVVGAALKLWHEGMPAVSILVGVTTTVMPALEVISITWLTLPLMLGRRPPGFAWVFRSLQIAHPWAMVEVFILGILVSLVKLSHLAEVLPGPAMLGFALLMLVLATVSTIIEPRDIWKAWEEAKI